MFGRGHVLLTYINMGISMASGMSSQLHQHRVSAWQGAYFAVTLMMTWGTDSDSAVPGVIRSISGQLHTESPCIWRGDV
jgi:hypothetical protein